MMFDYSIIISALDTEEQRITAEYICENFDKLMYSIAFKILKNEPDAEDAVVQTVINICDNIDRFLGKEYSDIQRMVGRYSYNVAINIYNKNKRILEHTAIVDNQDIVDNTLTKDDVDFITDPNHYGELQKYIVKFDNVTKHLLLLRYVYEMSCEEIAKKLHMSASTVSTKTNRAIKKMKMMYENDHNGKGIL